MVISEIPPAAPTRKQRCRTCYHARPKAQRRKVVLKNAGASAQRDGGQKLLQRLVLFALDRLLPFSASFSPRLFSDPRTASSSESFRPRRSPDAPSRCQKKDWRPKWVRFPGPSRPRRKGQHRKNTAAFPAERQISVRLTSTFSQMIQPAQGFPITPGNPTKSWGEARLRSYFANRKWDSALIRLRAHLPRLNSTIPATAMAAFRNHDRRGTQPPWAPMCRPTASPQASGISSTQKPKKFTIVGVTCRPRH